MSPSAPPIVNAMSVDVEEYFHASALEPVAPRVVLGVAAEPRGADHAHAARPVRVPAACGPRSSSWAGSPTGIPTSSATSRPPATKSPPTATGTRSSTRSRPPSSERTCDEASRCSRISPARRWPGIGLRASASRASPCGPSTSSSRKGYRYDASIFPVRHDRYGIPDAPRHTYTLEQGERTITEVPPSTIRLGGQNLAVAGGGLFPVAALRLDTFRDGPPEPAGSSGRRSSTCIRGRSTPSSPACRWAW